ncbi:hypothetical protein [Castellaniella daejeonensis]|uniref:hypothetical protein n=1 Tax=Castellaniella daejeonensis TaxID=659013 RepID=UPI0031D77E4C
MYEQRTAELQSFIMSISDPRIRPFLDLKKLCQSGIYDLAVKMATAHAVQHGDFCYLQKILIVLDGSIHVNEFIASLRPKLNFIIMDAKPRYFKKATPERIAEVNKRAQKNRTATTAVDLSKPITKRAAKNMFKSTSTAQPTRRRAKGEKSSHDIMDSRLMLPGSYGTGRRK